MTGDRPSYRYCVVTLNGHGRHGAEFVRCADAKARAARLAETSPMHGPYEVERIQHFPGGSRRYWMRRRARWVPWDVHQDHAARKPDWIYGASS